MSVLSRCLAVISRAAPTPAKGLDSVSVGRRLGLRPSVAATALGRLHKEGVVSRVLTGRRPDTRGRVRKTWVYYGAGEYRDGRVSARPLQFGPLLRHYGRPHPVALNASAA